MTPRERASAWLHGPASVNIEQAIESLATEFVAAEIEALEAAKKSIEEHLARNALLEAVAEAARIFAKEAEGREMDFGLHKYLRAVTQALAALDKSGGGE